jgi:diguanylate cyclase (GGDEF)-like protein
MLGSLVRCGRRTVLSRHGAALLAGLALVALAPRPAAALDPDRTITQYASRLWTTDHGLPQNTITAICQTRDNFLWLGTKAGLTRFDGIRFEVFDAGNTPEMPDSWVTSLLEDKSGRLWIGSWLGLTVYENGVFKRFRKIEETSPTVLRVFESRTGDLWMATARGLARYDGTNITAFDARHGLGPGYVRDIAEDRNGVLWVASEGGGVARLDGQRFVRFTTRDGLPSDSAWRLLVDRNGTLWVGTYKGLCRLEGKRFAPYSAPTIPRRDIRVLFEDRFGSIWVGGHGGISRLQGHASASGESERGLPEQVVSAFAEDHDGSFWVGTDNGLWRLSARPFTVWGRSEGLPRDVIWAVFEDQEGVIWLGTDGAGLFALKNGRIVRSYSTAQGLPGDAINSLFEDRDGRLWIGTDLGLASLENGKIKSWGESEGVFPRITHALGEDASRRLLVGQTGRVLRLEASGFRDMTAAWDLVRSDPVTSFEHTSDGSLWITTAGSGARQVMPDGQVRSFDESKGLPNGYVYSLHESTQGTLWLATGGRGLCRFKNGKFTSIGHAQGMPDDVFGAVEDARGNFWVSSHHGVVKVGIAELEAVADGRAAAVDPVVLDTADGLRSHECVDGGPGLIRGRDGVLWFATSKGVARINPEGDWPALRPSPVVLQEILQNQVALPAHTRVLSAGVRNLEFRYTAPSFIAPEKVRFRYKLEGYDTGWNDAESRRAAYYTNVRGGRYRFVVAATLDSRHWNGPETAIDLEVEKHFFESGWAYLGGVLLVALAGAGIQRVRHRARFHRLQERERELRDLVETRTNELRLAKESLEERARALTAANAQLEQLSKLDSLTGVQNRRAFDAAIEDEWRRALRLGTPLSLMFLDLDFFKGYNDRYGHPAGDECLRRVAQLLEGSLQRVADLVARYGGEEFVIVLPNTALAGAEDMARRIRAAVEDMGIVHEGGVGGVVTVSLGAACVVPTPSSNPAVLIEAADRALYRSKREGRNCVRTG